MPSTLLTFQNIIIFLIAVNAITFFLYWLDKRASRGVGYRIPEKTLLMFAFVGGTPAALIAARIFRHKTKKKSFRASMFFVILAQIIILFYFLIGF